MASEDPSLRTAQGRGTQGILGTLAEDVRVRFRFIYIATTNVLRLISDCI
jgi:hypothetical protein